MAKVMVPIIKLKYDEQDAFPLAACEILDFECGDQQAEEPYTYTWRIGGPDRGSPEFEPWRENVCARLRAEVEDKVAAERLIAFLDANEWDASFFVDGY